MDRRSEGETKRAGAPCANAPVPAIERIGKETLHRIVVVGGGAGGLDLVTPLGDRWGRCSRASVTLIECARTHVWKPLLHAVAAGSLDPNGYEVNYLAQAHWHGFRYRFGQMVGLDRTGKQVHLGATFDEDGRQITASRSIGYDTLVIAIGRVTNDFGTPYLDRNASPAPGDRRRGAHGARVTAATGEGLRLADGSFVASELLVWAAGVKAPDVLRHLDGLEVNRINQLLVEPTSESTRDPDIFAIGDCAACPRRGNSGTVPPRAQAAHQQAAHMARQIERRLRGLPLSPYVYRDFGSLVQLHQRAGT